MNRGRVDRSGDGRREVQESDNVRVHDGSRRADRELGFRANAIDRELVEWCRDHDFNEGEADAIETIGEAFDRAAFAGAPAERKHTKIALESANRVHLDGL